MWGEKAIPRFIVVLPLLGIMLIAGAATYFYVKNTHRYFNEQSERIKREHTAAKEKESQEWINRTKELFAYSDGALEEKIKNRLRTRVLTVNEMAAQIYEKYANKKTARQQIKNALSRMVWEGQANTIRITDYEGENILPGTLGTNRKNIAGYSDADGRAIILEEIQKARRYGEGFIQSRLIEDGSGQITYVKDFGKYGWYFASSIRTDEVRNELKDRMCELLNKVPEEAAAFRAVFDKNTTVYISQEAQKYLDATQLEQLRGTLKPDGRWQRFERDAVHLYAAYFAPFGWYVLHGFETASLDAEIARQQLWLNEKMNKEIEAVYIGSALLSLLFFILFLLFGWRIRRIIAAYKEKSPGSETGDEPIRTETRDVQMVAADEAVGMIAHQWRQPFKRLSWVLREIEKAYGLGELTPELLEEKIREGMEELAFMSHTVEGFKSSLSLAWERTEISVAEAVDSAADLIAKTLEVHGIGLEVTHHAYNHVTLERTLLIQMLLFLMSVAKNVLLRHGAQNPMIKVSTGEDGLYVFIEVCSNAGRTEDSDAAATFSPEELTSSGGSGFYAARRLAEKYFSGALLFENRSDGLFFTVKIAKSRAL